MEYPVYIRTAWKNMFACYARREGDAIQPMEVVWEMRDKQETLAVLGLLREVTAKLEAISKEE